MASPAMRAAVANVTQLEATVHVRQWTQWKRGGWGLAVMVALIFGAPLCRAQPAFPLHTAGPYIADSNGHRVRLNAVNWYGSESVDYVVGGLQSASLQSLVDQIRSIGFNAVRLPWSNELYEQNPVVPDYALAANTNMQGENALTVLDQVISALSRAGIMVILDNHNSNAEWCCSNSDGNTLWYNSQYPESAWIADWQGIVQRYAGNPWVIGVDLRNEPRGSATWGGSASTDWHAAAQRAGNAVLGVNSNLLIFVEGINFALDLSGAGSLPVQLNTSNRVVYEAHDYGFDYSGLTGYSDYVSRIGPRWGYLVTGNNPQPVWVGEFGTCNTAASCVSSNSSTDNGFWFGFLTTWLQNESLDWSYWAVNGTQSTGRTYGAAETYGVLNTGWNASGLAALTAQLQDLMTTGGGPAAGTYRIANVHSGLDMEVNGQSTSNGTAVDQWSYWGGANQKWNLSYLNNGMYKLTAVNGGLALDVTGQSAAYGASVDQWTYWGGGNQQYVVSRTSDGNYRLLNANSGLAIEVPGFSTTNGTVLDQWGWNAGTNQEWQFLTP